MNLKKIIIAILGLCFCLSAQETDKKQADWVIWLSGASYVQEWSTSVEATLGAMKNGETALICMPGMKSWFTKVDNLSQLNEIVSQVRATFEMNGQRSSQLIKEMVACTTTLSDNITRGTTGGGRPDEILREYLAQRKQLMTLYNEGSQTFWQELDTGLLLPSARLVVVIQQFDIPIMDRDTMEAMRNNPTMSSWILELQDFSPWEPKNKILKKMAESLNKQNSRVDCLYLRAMGKEIRSSKELSKTFQKGIGVLTKKTGGINQNLQKEKDVTTAALLK